MDSTSTFYGYKVYVLIWYDIVDYNYSKQKKKWSIQMTKFGAVFK